jgi:SAM-dependent methyltransferase
MLKRNYLKDFLLVAPLSHALWRSVEAISFSSVDLKEPILDLGCGFGEFSGVVFGNLECGIDVNKKDLGIAFKVGRYRKVVHADARNLPFSSGEYAGVISVSVMEHIPNAEKVIPEVKRVLKRGGVFAFSVPTTKLYESLFFPKIFSFLGLNSLAGYYIKLHKRVFQHVTIKTSAWWEKQLKKEEFRIIKKEGTISKQLVGIHEIFLLTAFPSQLWRWVFGKRLVIFPWRAKILPLFFSKYVYTDKKCDVNMFFVAQKR